MNMRKTLVAALMGAGLMVAGGAANAALTSTVTTDTATNLDVTWMWDGASLDVSTPTLSNWSATLNTGSFNLGSSWFDAVATASSYLAGGATAELGLMVANNTSPSGLTTFTSGLDTFTLSASGTANAWAINLQGVHAVPEPGELALMMSGLGLMGYMVRRRHKNVA